MHSEDQPKIRVVVRKRPLTKRQISRGDQDIVQIRSPATVIVRQLKHKVDLTKYIDEHSFNFDSVFAENVSNEQIYQSCVRPIVESAFLGAKVTCFAYGQTGSGKTYTMNGDLHNKVSGMYVLGAKDIFHIKEQNQYRHLAISMSFYEIYCGKLYDLLNNREILQAREDAKQNVNIIGLTQKRISSVQNFMQIIEHGSSVRITSQNSTNADSSRSHAILQISIIDGKKSLGKISFIDLAGCERGADTFDQSKQTRIDGSEINKSLLALKQCIRALDNGKSHTPFRGSKLTMVLKDSFTGFCKTLMIGNISPNSSSCENTLNTLRYADRVKELKKGSIESMTKEDQLARQLMLPRMMKNKQILNITEDDEQIEQKLFVPRRIESNKMEEQKLKTQRDSSKKKGWTKQNNENMLFQERRQYNNTAEALKNNNSVTNQLFNNSNSKSLSRVSLHSNTINQQRNSCLNKNSFQGQRLIKSSISKNVPQHQQQSNWESILECFRRWEPQNPRQVEIMSLKYHQMVNHMMKEEIELIGQHKTEIEHSNQLNQQSTKLYNQVIEDDKSNQQLFEYTHVLENIVDHKIELLFQMKNKLQSYRQHLMEHQECERRLSKVSEHFTKAQQEDLLLGCENTTYYQNFQNHSKQVNFLNNFQVPQIYPSQNHHSERNDKNFFSNKNTFHLDSNIGEIYNRGQPQIESLFGPQWHDNRALRYNQ